MDEMTELGTILFYILLHTLFVTCNYQVIACYIHRLFLCTLSQCMAEVCEHKSRYKPLNQSSIKD